MDGIWISYHIKTRDIWNSFPYGIMPYIDDFLKIYYILYDVPVPLFSMIIGNFVVCFSLINTIIAKFMDKISLDVHMLVSQEYFIGFHDIYIHCGQTKVAWFLWYKYKFEITLYIFFCHWYSKQFGIRRTYEYNYLSINKHSRQDSPLRTIIGTTHLNRIVLCLWFNDSRIKKTFIPWMYIRNIQSPQIKLSQHCIDEQINLHFRI